jgi:hypothetical protein
MLSPSPRDLGLFFSAVIALRPFACCIRDFLSAADAFAARRPAQPVTLLPGHRQQRERVFNFFGHIKAQF